MVRQPSPNYFQYTAPFGRRQPFAGFSSPFGTNALLFEMQNTFILPWYIASYLAVAGTSRLTFVLKSKVRYTGPTFCSFTIKTLFPIHLLWV